MLATKPLVDMDVAQFNSKIKVNTTTGKPKKSEPNQNLLFVFSLLITACFIAGVSLFVVYGLSDPTQIRKAENMPTQAQLDQRPALLVGGSVLMGLMCVLVIICGLGIRNGRI